MDSATRILKKHQLRHTDSREEILNLFLAQVAALSQPEIEKAVVGCDRVTIYRTLSTYMEKGILHKVLDDQGVMKYALCKEGCESEGYHSHDHVHFKCASCGDTTCIEQVHIPQFSLPEGFVVQEVNVLMQGVCPKCG